ncbi:MAG: class I SAM-dependent methyltransferase [Chloroflexota bacterium]|nr:class I SAM-dependent methyltransferase [Chloroflexota bacterium]
MNHTDHVHLLRGGIPSAGGIWADLGAGTGAFTLALAELIGPTGEIYAIDKDAGALRQQERAMRATFAQQTVYYRTADFVRLLDLPLLDGIVLANSLHFQRDPAAVIALVQGYLRPGGRLLIVEYNVERGNFAVPYPVPYTRWKALAQAAGFVQTQLLATRPSRFLREIYAAVSVGGAVNDK